MTALYFEGLYPEYYEEGQIYPYIDHFAHNYKLGQPVKILAELLKFLNEKVIYDETLRGEFINDFELYLAKCIDYIMSDTRNLIELYLYYRDTYFQYDMWIKSLKGVGSSEHTEDQIHYKIVNDLRKHLDFQEFISARFKSDRNSPKDPYNIYKDYLQKVYSLCTECTYDEQCEWTEDRAILEERKKTILKCVLICIGRTIDILAMHSGLEIKLEYQKYI